jgi:hypothetical protein
MPDAGHAVGRGSPVVHAARAAATSAHVKMERGVAARRSDMQGFWIILLEIAVVLAIAAFILWWTIRR